MNRLPRFIWRLFHFLPPRLAYACGLGSLVDHFVLLLHTTGRKTGLRRCTPLQYDVIAGSYYVGSARGRQADWYQNLVHNPRVTLQIGTSFLHGLAEPLTDPNLIADFVAYRLKKHPIFIGTLLRMEGLGKAPTRTQLVQYAQHRTLVAIHPDGEQDQPDHHPPRWAKETEVERKNPPQSVVSTPLPTPSNLPEPSFFERSFSATFFQKPWNPACPAKRNVVGTGLSGAKIQNLR